MNESRRFRRHSPRYTAYMRSPQWSARRYRKLESVGFRCEKCRARKYLEVHHKTYARLGKEQYGDLEVLCRDCHDFQHGCIGGPEVWLS